MKKQLTPTQMLWMFGGFAFLAFILASYTFLSFRQAFRMNSDVPAPPEDEKTSKLTILEHGVNVAKTGGAKIVVSDEQTDGLEEEAQNEQPPMTENTASVVDNTLQPANPSTQIVQPVEEKHDQIDKAKLVSVETQSKGIAVSSDVDKTSKPLLSTNGQKQSAVILTANASSAQPLPLGESKYQKFPECRVYLVKSKADFKETFDKIDSLSPLAAFYDQDGVKFNLQQAKAGKDVQYNMIVWDGFINIKKAGTYTFLLTWVVPSGPRGHANTGSIGLLIKDQKILISRGKSGQTSQGQVDVNLKAGWNKLRLCVLSNTNIPFVQPSNPVIRYKPWNVIGEPREFKPAELTHQVNKVDW